MVGRVVFAFSSAVVNSMFPLVAGTRDEDRNDLKVVATSLLLVLTIGLVIAIGLRFVPAAIWTGFFWSEIPYRRGVWPIVSIGSVRYYYGYLFTERRDH